MDQRKPPTSKRPERRQDTAPVLVIPPRLVHSALGAILIAAGTFKLYESAFVAQDEGAATLLLAIFAEAELLGGIWLVGGFAPEQTHLWALAAFAGLTASSLFRGLAGRCSCGCFGAFAINPWAVLVFDLAAVSALLAWRPPADPAATPAHPARLLGLVLLAMAIGAAGWRQADLVTVAGTVTADGRPLEEATLEFTGDSGKIVLRTDHDGNFRLPLVRPGLYSVYAPGRVAVVPIPRNEPINRRPRKKEAQRSRHQFSPYYQPVDREPLIWLEISKCSEHDKIINF